MSDTDLLDVVAERHKKVIYPSPSTVCVVDDVMIQFRKWLDTGYKEIYDGESIEWKMYMAYRAGAGND